MDLGGGVYKNGMFGKIVSHTCSLEEFGISGAESLYPVNYAVNQL